MKYKQMLFVLLLSLITACSSGGGGTTTPTDDSVDVVEDVSDQGTASDDEVADEVEGEDEAEQEGSAEEESPGSEPVITNSKGIYNIMLVGGFFYGPNALETVAGEFMDLGYTVTTPLWPLHDGQAYTEEQYAALGFSEVFEHFRGVLQAQTAKQIVVCFDAGCRIIRALMSEPADHPGAVLDKVAGIVPVNMLPARDLFEGEKTYFAEALETEWLGYVAELSFQRFIKDWVSDTRPSEQEAAYAHVVPESARLMVEVEAVEVDHAAIGVRQCMFAGPNPQVDAATNAKVKIESADNLGTQNRVEAFLPFWPVNSYNRDEIIDITRFDLETFVARVDDCLQS